MKELKPQGQRIAFTRLVAVVAILVVAGMFSCKPAWSPDGKRLLFTAHDNEGAYTACYDLETGKAFQVMSRSGLMFTSRALWTSDGKHAVMVSCPHKNGFRVSVSSVPPVGDPRTFDVPSKLSVADAVLGMSAVIVGDQLFLTSEDVLRVDLETGKFDRIKAEDPNGRLVVSARGDGLCCTEVVVDLAKDKMTWRVDSLDPASLQRTRLLDSESFGDLVVSPQVSFSADFERIAMPSCKRDQILVFRDGKLEATLPLGEQGKVEVSEIVMPGDGATIYATVCRNIGQARFAWSLVEGSSAGVLLREKRLFASDKVKAGDIDGAMPATTLGLSVSPDGALGAVTTALTPEVRERERGLYLIDLVGRQRTVTRVPFPGPRELTVVGSDTMLPFAARLAKDYAKESDQSLSLMGGGSGPGLLAVSSSRCDLAMTIRKPRPAELKVAKDCGVELIEHQIGNYAVEVSVNVANPVTSLTTEQLTKIFGPFPVTKWSELGVKMPEGLDRIEAAVGRMDEPGYSGMRSAMLGTSKFGKHVTTYTEGFDLREHVIDNKNAIVCVGQVHATAWASDVRTLAIQQDAKSPALLPQNGSRLTESYPLTWGMYFYTRKGGSRNSRLFLNWLRSLGGESAILDSGY